MNLKNKRILITRPRAQAEEFARALSEAGAQPIFFPVIEIAPPQDFSALDRALRGIDQYDWLILTSVHGVEAFFKRRDALGVKIPSRLRVAAVGPRTARRLSDHDVWVDYVPEEYLAEALLPGMGGNIYGKRILLPQSDIAYPLLAREIRSAGGLVDEVVAYRTVLSQPHASELNELHTGVDIVTFTSPSTVRNFVDVIKNNGLDPLKLTGAPLFVCIGPVTKKAAEEIGLKNLVSANKHTFDGIVEAIGQLAVN